MGARVKFDRLPGLEVLGLLAEGGMSEVYLGRRADSSDLVVLKRLPPEHSLDPSMVRMFRDEARISRLVSGHPNVVRYLEEGELDGSRYIAFELVEGLTVAEILNRSAARGAVVMPLTTAIGNSRPLAAWIVMIRTASSSDSGSTASATRLPSLLWRPTHWRYSRRLPSVASPHSRA